MSIDPFFIVAAVACFFVLGILIFGIFTFAKGGEFNRRNANKIMRWRLGAQLAAVLLILFFVWWRTNS